MDRHSRDGGDAAHGRVLGSDRRGRRREGRCSSLTAWLIVGLVATVTGTLLGGPAARAAGGVRVIARGLDNPQGVAVDGAGRLHCPR